MKRHAFAALAVTSALLTFGACTIENTECVPGDPKCPGRTAAATTDASASQPASDASTLDVCLVVLDSGASRGCGSGANGNGDRDEGGGADAVAPPDVAVDASNLPFLAPCDRNDQCASGLCYDFVVKGYFCTKTCASDADCPAPSPGCSGMNVCRAPG